MKQVAVLTSGGDAPGMNAAIRAVVRSGISRGWQMHGVRHGYAGLMAGNFIPLSAREVGGIIQHAGTILGSTRAPEFTTPEGRTTAVEQLEKAQISGLVVVGGNGSQAGAASLAKLGVPVVGIASTIDNDLVGADITIGVDTALNVALESIDRLRATAASHERAFLVEVMGRECGYLAVVAAIAGGAEAVVIPEIETGPDFVIRQLHEARARGKSHGIVVVAEGSRYNADAIARHVVEHRDEVAFELRTTKLGHVQRGGTPTVSDRLLATELGVRAVEELADDRAGVLVGLQRGEMATTELSAVAAGPKPLDLRLYELAEALSR